MPSRSSKQYVFVVGCPGSGANALRKMLDDRASLAGKDDALFIPKSPGELATKTLDAGSGGEAPDNVRRLALLHVSLPGAKTVHVIRDGRDVALAMLDGTGADDELAELGLWESEPIAACALWWRWQVRSACEGGARLGPDRYLEVAYEALLADPDAQLRRIAEFLRDPGASPERLSWRPTSDLRDWRTQMRERDLELFEALAGDLLDDLGMERAFHRISPAFARIAAEQARWWREHVARREANESRAEHRGSLAPKLRSGSSWLLD